MVPARFALRNLRRSPGFALSATLVLVLALGANATVLGLLRGLVLRPLPAPHPDELVGVSTRDSQGSEAGLTWRQFGELRRHQQVFSSMLGSVASGVMTTAIDGGTIEASAAGVTGEFFGELGATATVGRLINDHDLDVDASTAQPVVVLSWSFWQRHFKGDRDAVGRFLTVEGRPLTVIGVAPPGFRGVGIAVEPDITVPLPLVPTLAENEAAMLSGTSRWVTTVGRLAPGQSLTSARAHIETLWPDLRDAAMPPTLTGGLRDRYQSLAVDVQSASTGVERSLRRRFTRALLLLMALACLLLVAAAVNLGSLMFARVEGRQQELALRLALGARRGALMRDAAWEGGFIGALSGAVACVLAAFAAPALASLILEEYIVPTTVAVAPDGPTVAATLAGGVLAGVLTSVLCSWHVLRRGTGSSQVGSSRVVAASWRVGRVLVGAQVAVSIVVVSMATMLSRNVGALTTADPGHDIDGVYVGYPHPRVGAYRQLDAGQYYQQALARVRAVPGVQAAAFSTQKPRGGAMPMEPVGLVGTAPGSDDRLAEVTSVSPGFFDALGIPVIQGRDISSSDTEDRPRVAVVSRSLARQLFGDGPAVGRRIRVSARPEGQAVEVVGVVADAALFDVRQANVSVLYTAALQSGTSAHYKCLVVRAQARSLPEVRMALESGGVESMPQIVSLAYITGRTLLEERLLAMLSGYGGAVGLVLVIAGMYGLLVYVQHLRRKEIGVRMALGADPARVVRMVLGDAWRVSVVGIGVGLLATYAASDVLRTVLLGSDALDPWAAGVAAVLVLGAATVAAARPALRAARVDPLMELRRD